MGLFDKKFCSVCGEKIGFLGNRKLEDGNLCKDCARKLSPFFRERRSSTVEEIRAFIAKERTELVGDFCRGCGYCMPCPVGIQINNAARMSLMLRRAPTAGFLSEYWQAEMARIDECLECGQCASRCPYHLDTPSLLQYMLKDYDEFYAQHHND